jgi:group II intron reverse transcriptase/maturase
MSGSRAVTEKTPANRTLVREEVRGAENGHPAKVGSLIDKVWYLPNLRRAWKLVKANHGTWGVDRQSLEAFEAHLEEELVNLQAALRADAYVPLPGRRIYVPKPDGRRRGLAVPAVRDRVCQQALRLRLEPYFEARFAETNYGFRPGRSAHQAIGDVVASLRQGGEWVVEVDIETFFDTASHERLLAAVAEVVADGRVLRLVQAFLQAGVMEDGKKRTLVAGTPQGGVLSPLLSNAFLNTFDHQMLAAGHRAVRYADDLVVVCRTREEAQAALERVHQILEGQLGLRLHPQKTRIVHITEGFEFLGFRFWQDDQGLHLQPRARAVQRLKEKVRYLTRRLQPRRVDQLVAALNPVVRGWGGYFRIGELRRIGQRLDRWILRRLRAFMAKRWRTANWRRYPNAFFYRRMGLCALRDFS